MAGKSIKKGVVSECKKTPSVISNIPQIDPNIMASIQAEDNNVVLTTCGAMGGGVVEPFLGFLLINVNTAYII